MSRVEVRIAGFGGQGVVLSGILLGNASVLYDNKCAVQTQTYGAAARGGAARSDVIIDENTIVYPQVTAPDIMIAFTQEAMKKYQGDLRENAILIIDEDLVIPPEGTALRIFCVPATRTAVNDLGRGIVANMIMLGFLVALTGIVSLEALKESIRTNVPKGTEKLNLAAFSRGVELAEVQKKD